MRVSNVSCGFVLKKDTPCQRCATGTTTVSRGFERYATSSDRIVLVLVLCTERITQMTFRWLEVTLSYCRRERRLRPRRFERGGSIARVGVCAMPFRSKLALRQRAQQRRFRFPMVVLLPMWWCCVLADTTICVSYRKCDLPRRTLADACNTTQYVL